MSKTAKDYASDQEVRWCPGCGDYAVLKAMQKSCAALDLNPDKTVFVSGIGCSSRFPYYMKSYGFHAIHGRAPAIASGIKLMRPELDVWIITGDGDGLSIGSNHLLHILRRNIDCQILLFNNEIYGLTKGQYSPTSRAGTITPSSPKGSQHGVIDPVGFAFGAGGRFIARALDTKQQELVEIMKQAYHFKGAAFVEIFQNCIVYNDNVFGDFTDRDKAPLRQLWLTHGQKMLFGEHKEKGLSFREGALVVTEADASDALVHNHHDRLMACALAAMGDGFPVALGVLYQDPRAEAFTLPFKSLKKQTKDETTQRLNGLLQKKDSWRI